MFRYSKTRVNGALFKANEIKCAVQGGQAQIGEVLLASLANEDALYAGRMIG